MRLNQTLLLLAVLVNPLASLAAADTAPTGNGQSYLVAQVDPRRDDSRPVDKKETDDRARANRDSSSNSATNVPRPLKSADLTECRGEFALCAASTCKPTGRMIKVKEAGGKTTKEYPESVCTCPIITQEIAVMNGKPLSGIAGLNEGNMNGSCDAPGPGKIWSLFSPLKVYPQESTNPPFQMRDTIPQTCSTGTGSNCWSYECTIDKEPAANGVRTATCACPIGENPLGAPTQNGEFLAAAGAYFANPSSACSMYPVSIPNFTDLK